ncbi:E3 ubiquitin/ISG15 ligase TRIM25-like isoform X1 [Astyanax mexicanus]|uniref:E3 ubiquitin/ISG15 ligase TRIM25-like isoform X1 n=1 Tax=Astyanax mexicanus TaxID=7994 RepID=UPI0020CB414D|nr:E3 ubiquitin/ISG15 ligase TRIM25-like isoform X1 [Astyanax mexicanus]
MLRSGGCVGFLSCPVCLERLRDPVTIPCGHSYCKRCISQCWDEEQLQKKAVSCPQCRGCFPARPALNRSTVLSEVLDSVEPSPAEPRGSSPGSASLGGECNFCSGAVKSRAVKSCLTCVASFCETHLRPHLQFPVLQRHALVEATSGLQEMICSRHNKLLEVFCVQDKRCICLLCAMDEHSGHTTVSAAKEWCRLQQKPLQKIQERFHALIQCREKELQALNEAVKAYSTSAQAAMDLSKEFLAEITKYMEKNLSLFCYMIQYYEKKELHQTHMLQKKLEQVIAHLKRSDAECSQLKHTDDPILCLQKFLSLTAVAESEVPRSNPVSNNHSFLSASHLLLGLKEQMKKLFDEEMIEMNTGVKQINIILPPKPKTRLEFKKHYCQLKLSPDSCNSSLQLSEENRKVQFLSYGTYSTAEPHADRFIHTNQVLCDGAVRGCCYWEVKWQDKVNIALSYGSIVRNACGDSSKFGYNDQSWSLECDRYFCKFRHNSIVTEVSTYPPEHIGVYLDEDAGVLAFYRVCSQGPMTLLYKTQAEFTKPLYPGFTLDSFLGSSSVTLC